MRIVYMNKKEKALFNLCADENFDKATAQKLIEETDINKEFIKDPRRPGITTTFLFEAANHTNIEMVRLLLENGADPNFILCEDQPCSQDNPFWNTQYSPGETEEEHNAGLQIAQLMLEYGANPNIELNDEDLMSYVCFEVFNAESKDEQWEYRKRFFILLIAYGGSNHYIKPQITGEFDKTNMSQYRFKLVPVGNGYHLTGEITAARGEVVAKV